MKLTKFLGRVNSAKILFGPHQKVFADPCYRVPSVALCITHVEPELTARPWFQVLNSHQGQSAYSGLSDTTLMRV